MLRNPSWLIALFLLSLLGGNRLHAQATAAKATEAPGQAGDAARTHHRDGVSAYAEGRYADAIEAFLAADRLRPSPGLSFNIAKAYESLDEPARALQYYREYLFLSQRAACSTSWRTPPSSPRWEAG